MLKKNFIQLAAFTVAVLLIVLGLTINLDTIKSWVLGNRITVTSVTRGKLDEYLAGEVLRLSVDIPRSPRVFWIFDENQAVMGAIEAQYAFPFNVKAPTGQASDHRVDAFFKISDSYKAASIFIRTRNVKYTAIAGIRESEVVLTAPTAFDVNWSLTGASLAKFTDGKFTRYGPLPLRTTKATKEFVATQKETQTAFGYSETTNLASKLSDDTHAWTSYDFVNKLTGAKLTIAQPLAEVAAKWNP